VGNLPYGRNKNKNDLSTVLNEMCGTCSTKHALLKQLCDENNFHDVKLFVGLFKMNKNNTPEVTDTLKRNKLKYLPEAHCYLKYHSSILDFTKSNSKPAAFINFLIEEMEIVPNQITGFKVAYHKNYLRTWLLQNSNINFTLSEIWKIREQCICDLTVPKN
jgi:hypothetical protein